MQSRRTLFAIVPLLAAYALPGQGVPATINYQGRLTDNTPGQVPINGTVAMKFEIFDAPAAGSSLWSEIPAGGVSVSGGIFNVALGATTPLGPAVFTGATSIRYLEITLNPGAAQEILAPRQRIGSSGYAGRAENAASADGAVNFTGPLAGDVTGTQSATSVARLAGRTLSTAAPAAGQSLTWNGATSAWEPAAYPGWRTAGNLATNPPGDYLGTADAKDLVFKTAGAPRLTLGAAGGLTALAPSGYAGIRLDGSALTLGDAGGNAFANTLNIDFENTPRFWFMGANVGIGIPLPNEALDVAGNVRIPAANDYKYAGAKTHYYSVSSTAFQTEAAASYSRGYIGGNVYLATGSPVTVGYLDAPVNLPDGATVTAVAFYVVDNDGSYNLQPGALWRVDSSLSTSYGNSIVMASVPIPASSNSTLMQLTSTSTIASPVIDNQNYSYYLRWGTQQSNVNLRLNRALITYTVSKAD